MTTNHNYYLDLAFQLAKKNLGKTGLNPTVGSLVVKNNTVISSAVTSINGRPHSEFNALNKVKNISGATLYTTLEPCTHLGKTPPCVNIILKKKIRNVYYAFEDPDIRTFKKAKKFLTSRGIKTKLIKSKKHKNFYKSYFINKQLGVPYISAKIAMSKDYLTINKKKKWITNDKSRKIVHLLRSEHDSIMSTSKSINLDNSLLNCRIEGLNYYKPDLFIIDLNLKLKKKLLLNKILKKRKTYLITKKSNNKKTIFYKKLGYKIILINSLENKQDLFLLFAKIYKLGYSRIFVEAGLNFLNTLLRNKIIKDLYIFISGRKLGKNGKNNGSLKYFKKFLTKKITINLNDDKLYKKEF
jgi:diaminohydroxyphosphoribosylaminopyrimidine deaminase / 5-amino-6-(5-phosphoribosylamino)uracil reductase